MNAQIQVALIAAGCTSAVGVMGTGVIRLLRRASLRLSVQVGGAVMVLAVAGATLGTAKAMFISPHDLGICQPVWGTAECLLLSGGFLLLGRVDPGCAWQVWRGGWLAD